MITRDAQDWRVMRIRPVKWLHSTSLLIIKELGLGRRWIYDSPFLISTIMTPCFRTMRQV
ncbi:unnamed protein product [Penicillium roqueforti FM164]|uniref:Genomic scaffold, ProqFM164S01 n=1 Tax=Penicillium roqueforti (strain FM164) TaxID=1365484 RepID=W6PUH7_PENRF|nr:unnamed protein product [Penicillium roqueforti FM164]